MSGKAGKAGNKQFKQSAKPAIVRLPSLLLPAPPPVAAAANAAAAAAAQDDAAAAVAAELEAVAPPAAEEEDDEEEEHEVPVPVSQTAKQRAVERALQIQKDKVAVLQRQVEEVLSCPFNFFYIELFEWQAMSGASASPALS